MTRKQAIYYIIVTAAILTVLEIPIAICTKSWWYLAPPTVGCIIGISIAKIGERIRQ